MVMRRNRSNAAATLVYPESPETVDATGSAGALDPPESPETFDGAGLTPVTLAGICREAIDEASLAHPGHPIEFERWDDAPGEWDRDGLLQMVRSLLGNALSHGAPGEPVIVSVIDCSEDALLAVANRGQPIPDPFRDHLFDPARRGAWSSDHLGLYLVQAIVGAHGGRIDLTSDDSATLFHVWLPKKRQSSAPQSGARGERS
jgi:signal transduction histidine kinase